MTKKKKYPTIKPLLIKDEKGKVVGIFLKFNVYQSILEEIEEFKKSRKKKIS